MLDNKPPTEHIEPRIDSGEKATKTSDSSDQPRIDSSISRIDPSPESEFVKWIEPETTLPVTTGEVSIQIPYCIDRTIIPRRRFLTAIREMTAKQRFGFQVLLEGMKDEGTGLQMGGRVTNHVSAMRAMLERIPDAVKGDCDG